MRACIIASLLICLVCLVHAVELPNTGSIKGVVIDDTGQPVGGAQVSAEQIDGRPSAKAVRFFPTDDEGHFLIQKLEWGAYKVFVMKEDAAYPNTQFAFYSNNIFPIITLTPSSPVGNVVLKTGPKAGILVGSVVDSITREPLSATFLLKRAANPNYSISTSQPSGFRVLVPSLTDVIVEVSVAGYKTWRYSSQDGKSTLRLKPGEEMRIEISLEPKAE